MRNYFIITIIVLFGTVSVMAQSHKREMRASWLTTVWSLDWPKTQVPPATGNNEAARQAAIIAQKMELCTILDSLAAANMNAVFFQVRGMCDAFYQSAYEPWSSYLTGNRGSDPGYDPLGYAIEQAHARGLELHAWLNPYRYSSSSGSHGNLTSDYASRHPNWLLDYGSYSKILNPGMPEVVQRIKDIIGDILSKYDVDGIVFDDYFYAYGGTPNTLDASAQALYKPSSQSIGDWRRANINRMVAAVYDTIQAVKPYVTFGISPFGTWTTDAQVAADRGILLPSGVGATGNMYAEIYCDPIAWLEEGTVDYVSPQLYWTTYSAYPYGKLAPWWSDITNRFGKHFYASQSLSSMTANAPKSIQTMGETILLNNLSGVERIAFEYYTQSAPQAPVRKAVAFLPSEIGLQIDFNRSSDINDAPGSVFYATNKIVNTTGFVNYLRSNKFTHKALRPTIGWKQAPDRPLVTNLLFIADTLSWTAISDMRYAVYAVPNMNATDSDAYSSAKYLLGITYNNYFKFSPNINSGTHKLAVAVVDRYGNEFSPAIYNEAPKVAATPLLTYPADNSVTLLPCLFTWQPVTSANSYIWQLATDSTFTQLVSTREVDSSSFLSSLQTNLADSTDYWWRVRAKVPNATAVWSEHRKLTSDLFSITSPLNGEGNVSVTPLFTWDNAGAGATYILEISTDVRFLDANKCVYLDTLTTTSQQLPTNLLLSYTTYYARVRVIAGSVKAVSGTVMFTTEELDIPVPQIILPTNGTVITSDTIGVTWAQQISNGFRVELSNSALFPPRSTTILSVSNLDFSATYFNLKPGVYYIRLKAVTNDGYTDPSTVVSVTVDLNSKIADVTFGEYTLYYLANGNIQIQFTNAIDKPYQLTLFTITGVTLFEAEIPEGSEFFELSTEELNRGVYLIKLANKVESAVLKFRK